MIYIIFKPVVDKMLLRDGTEILLGDSAQKKVFRAVLAPILSNFVLFIKCNQVTAQLLDVM